MVVAEAHYASEWRGSAQRKKRLLGHFQNGRRGRMEEGGR
jgi:hypothetical protein